MQAFINKCRRFVLLGSRQAGCLAESRSPASQVPRCNRAALGLLIPTKRNRLGKPDFPGCRRACPDLRVKDGGACRFVMLAAPAAPAFSAREFGDVSNADHFRQYGYLLVESHHARQSG